MKMQSYQCKKMLVTALMLLIAAAPTVAQAQAADGSGTPCAAMSEEHKTTARGALEKKINALQNRNDRQATTLERGIEQNIKRVTSKYSAFLRSTKVAMNKKIRRGAERMAIQEIFKNTVTPAVTTFEANTKTLTDAYRANARAALKTVVTDPHQLYKTELNAAMTEALDNFNEKCDEVYTEAREDLLEEIKPDQQTYTDSTNTAIRAGRAQLNTLHKELRTSIDTALAELKKVVKDAAKVRDDALKALRDRERTAANNPPAPPAAADAPATPADAPAADPAKANGGT